MLSQQVLTTKVIQYLRQNHDIRLNLPNLFCSIDSKVTLKYLKSFPINKSENRYRILLDRIDDLLKKNLLNLERIKQFSEDFFNTITEDIVILESNQNLRRKIPLVKDQILYKNEQISGLRYNIQTQCLMINDKDDILGFIAGNLKNYIAKLNIISEQYKNVNKIEVLTSINIDNIYQENSINDDEGQDYQRHYVPLLQVLNKLKANMIRIFEDIQHCDPYDIPLKCVNFLANCKNLLLELQPFLLKDDCAFNRLIFHVVRCQKENVQLIALNYQNAIKFCRSIVSDVFKSYFLGFMFKDYYRAIKQGLQNSRQTLLKVITTNELNKQQKAEQSLSEIKILQIIKQQSIGLQGLKQRIKQLKRLLSIGNIHYMKEYIRRKQHKKNLLIAECKQQYQNLKKIIEKFMKFLQKRKQISKLDNKQVQQSMKIFKSIKLIQKSNDFNNNIYDTIKEDEISLQKRFEQLFIFIQQLILQVNTIKIELQTELQTQYNELQTKQSSQQQILTIYLKQGIKSLKQINLNYLQLQIKLLNTFQSIKQQQTKLNQQSELIKQKTIQSIQYWFNNQIIDKLGYEINNEDILCEEVKSKISSIGKAQYMIKSYKLNNTINNKSQELKQLQYYKNNLEWLLVLFQGSMDQKILQMMMDKLDFQIQDYKQSQKKVQDLINQLQKYQKDLKKILTSITTPQKNTEMHPRVYKVIKDRLNLYEIIEDIYRQCLLVFKQTKKVDLAFNIQNKGLTLFNEPIYKYCLMLYQFKNKIRLEIKQLSELIIPSRCKNYLIDEIYEPFEMKFYSYVNFKEEELLNFVLRLEHALNMKDGSAKLIKNFEEVLLRQYDVKKQQIHNIGSIQSDHEYQDEEQYWTLVQGVSKEMVHIKQQNKKVIDLQNEPVVIHNLAQFKQIAELHAEHYKLAQNVVKQLSKISNSQDLQVNFNLNRVEFKNPKVLKLKQILLTRWEEHLMKNNLQQSQMKRSKNIVESRILNDMSREDQ